MNWIKILARTLNTRRAEPRIKSLVNKKPNDSVKISDTKKKLKPIKPLDSKTKKAPISRNKVVNKTYKIRPTTTGEWPHQDESLPTFQALLDEGYDTAIFVAHPNSCSLCKSRNGKKWKLADFISNLQYDAPIFERAAHVNAFSKIKVSDSLGVLEDVFVDYTGEISW